ncbi:MAG: Rpp14/Pop5 family protein [Ignisphaera sp.]
MGLDNLVCLIALILSILSISIIAVTIPHIQKQTKQLIEEFAVSMLTHKKHRRVKRYILVKFLCLDKEDYNILSTRIKNCIYAFLGPILRHKCSIEVVSYRPTSRRAIIRVRGEAVCVTYTLLALSIQHLKNSLGSCIAIPIRTSGLISRLRRRYLKA